MREKSELAGMTDAQWRGFLRAELRNQKEIKEALKNKDYEKAEKLIDKMINRTQQNIEDA